MSIVMVFYLVSLLGNLSVFSTIILVVLIIVAVITFINLMVSYEGDGEFPKDMMNIFRNLVIAILCCGLFNCFIPSTLSMYSMVGVKYLSDTQIPEKVAKLVNLKLDEFIDNHTKENK